MVNEIPGIKAVHVIVSDECRRKVEKTRVSAFTVAMQKLEAEIEPLINAHPIGSGVKFHFVLTVESQKGEIKQMSVIRCKVRVYSVFENRRSDTNEVYQEQINIGGVYSDDPESENRKWSMATPQFNLSMTINNPKAFGKLEQNKEYYLDFTEAE